MFEAHSNDDMITVLFFLDDVTEENGPLEVVPGTHTGPLFEHWHEGVFTGSVSLWAPRPKAVPCSYPCPGM